MPMDVPPQRPAHYAVAPVPADAAADIHAQVARFLGAERVRAERRSGLTIGSFDAARTTPPMDLSSPRLTPSDRAGISKVLQASREGRVASAVVPSPDGYVARRMGAAIMAARIAERSQSGRDVSASQIDAVRCRLVAVVMDPRAGGYVKGGERAAEASRAALSKGDVERCTPSLADQAARLSAGRTGVDPVRPKIASAAPTGQRKALPDLTDGHAVDVLAAARGSRGGRGA